MMRYEIKYAVEILGKEAIRASILMHPASFSKAYEDRQVNNIYLDTPQFHCFHQNVEGHPRRQKMRLRWYGKSKLPIDNSVLEIKQKDAELGWKDSTTIDGTIMRDNESMIKSLKENELLKSNLIPVLHNSYRRSYYVSQDGLFRITIDSQQAFKIPFSKMEALPMTKYPNIVELKYDEDKAELAGFITDYLPFRQTKNSKYTIGVEQLYF
ncbi:MAG: SPX domain protein involved in polyphosphate accumulation [Saprospiraceae bacterium]|jgi:SPX domain protein involved in polyphosphate accumulation